VGRTKKESARGKISRESVADAALQIADRKGFDAVTLRAVAAEVGASAMALYTYYPDKDALYEGMRERVFGHVRRGVVNQESWIGMLDGFARSVFRVMRAHPSWHPLLARAKRPPAPALDFVHELLQRMAKDGIGLANAMKAYASTMSFAVGSVLFEQLMLGGSDVSSKLALLQELIARGPDRYARVAPAAAVMDRWGFEDVFELGIRSLLKGIESELDPRKRRR
jgi:AcrR family transcriptional regulator